MFRHPPPRTHRDYPWPLYVFVAFFSVLWIVVVLRDQKFTWGEPDGVEIAAEESPVFFWGSIVFFSALLITMPVLMARGEAEHRRRNEMDKERLAEKKQRRYKRKKKR